MELTVERAEVRLISARTRMAAPEIGVLRISRFHERTDDEVGGALSALEHQGARALIVDLRSNGGGLMGSASPVAGRFLPAGPVAWQVDGHGESYAYTPPGERPIVSWPVVVLIDRGTASAAEVVAAALHDAAGAPLIGERTFGKGSVQYLRDLGDGAGVTITAARLVSPAGIRFDGVGLSPDIAVGASSPDGTDPALELAVRLLSLRLPVHAEPASPGNPTTEGR
jgi:carboxyl-terminal processing protease